MDGFRICSRTVRDDLTVKYKGILYTNENLKYHIGRKIKLIANSAQSKTVALCDARDGKFLFNAHKLLEAN